MEQAVFETADPRDGPAVRASGTTVREAREAIVRASGHVLTDYQREFLDDPAPLRAVLKARQTGFSWLFALEALAGAVAEGRFSIFVSLNHDEASEKVLYAREMLESLPEAVRPRILRGGTRELRLEGGGRLLSFPCRAPRGKARADLYLDEMAFYPNSEAVYTGALPVVSHGGRVTLASTPAGDRGMFWRAVLGRDVAGRYSQHRVPWWRAPWFCTEPGNPEIAAMDTEDRVGRFGAPVLARLYGAMDRDAFQQEYELRFADARQTFITWPEIEAAVEDAPLPATWTGMRAPGSALYAGMDIGRFHDATEIVVVAVSAGMCRVRGIHSLRQAPFQEQESAAARAMEEAGISRLCLDATGMGGPVAEALYGRFPGRVEPVAFTNARKLEMAADVKAGLQTGFLRLPRDAAFLEQVHSVQRNVTESGTVTLGAPSGGSHHGDQFWALALALRAARSAGAAIRSRIV